MIEKSALRHDAEAILTRVPRNRADAVAFCYGWLDQAVKSYLDGRFTRTDLRHNRELMELVLDLHRDREASITC